MARSSGERERLAIARHSSPCWRYCSVVCMTLELRMAAICSNAPTIALRRAMANESHSMPCLRGTAARDLRQTHSYVGNPTESTHARLDHPPNPTPPRPPAATGRHRPQTDSWRSCAGSGCACGGDGSYPSDAITHGTMTAPISAPTTSARTATAAAMSTTRDTFRTIFLDSGRPGMWKSSCHPTEPDCHKIKNL